MAKVPLRAYNREVEAMIDRGQLDEAIAHCIHIFKSFPKHLETYRLLGKAYLEYKRYKDAEDIFSRILVSEPNDFVANVGMSIIRDEENKLDDAIWHMERAFETQPSNAAIQSELQRLYGRRDGVQPPRIRMTRGALAHMYVQGELYPQAISEIKSVLKEDPGRSDMETLLARACYRSGLKNEAADAASKVLRRYPYCLDANRVLMEIFGVDRPENAQAYRQRVVELDPYAALVTGTVFQSNEVPDPAVNVERLDWNGQPVAPQPDWGTSQAISLESRTGSDEQPDWLRNAYADTIAPTSPSPTRPVDQPPPVSPTPAAEEEIPAFLRAAGWGQSTGAFDESKPIFGEDKPAAAQPIQQGEIPDWVKAMAPTESTPPPAEEEEEMPDWINKIGTGALPVPKASESNEVDWMSQLGQASEPTPSEQTTGNDFDWLNQLGETSESVPSPQPIDQEFNWLNQTSQPAQSTPMEQASDEQSDWMRQFDQMTSSTPVNDGIPDWMKEPDQKAQSGAEGLPSVEQSDLMNQFDQPVPSIPLGQPTDDQPDWMKQFEEPLSSTPASAEPPDWLRPLDLTPDLTASTESSQGSQQDWMKEIDESAPAGTSSGFDFLDQPQDESQQQVPATPAAPIQNNDTLGVSEQERDDSFAWLESLAAKQGASEGLLTKPEERLEEEPDWVKQAKGLNVDPPSAESVPAPQEEPEIRPPPSIGIPSEPPPLEEIPSMPPSTPQHSAVSDELGRSEQERDDSFAWLESLAARQGASEGLLTKPEERLEEEPDWVRQAKDLSSTAPAAQTPSETPSVEPSSTVPPTSGAELGKSEQERDDSFAWLESLAAKQGASEGLLTKPEERLEEEPDWVKQAKDLGARSQTLQPEREEAAPESAASDDTAMWLRGLEEEEVAPPPVSSAADETAMWLKGLDEEESKVEPASTPSSDETAMWLKGLSEEEAKTESVFPRGNDETGMWLRGLEKDESEVEVSDSSKSTEDETVMWLKSLDEAEKASAQPGPETPEQSDLPAWMQNIDEETPPAAELEDSFKEIETPPAPSFAAPKPETGALPSWLRGLENKEAQESSEEDELPAWLRDETGEVLAEPTKIEPTRSTDWQPAETPQAEPQAPESTPVFEPQPIEQSQPEPPQPVAPEPEPVRMREEPPSREQPAEPEPQPVPVPIPPQPYKEPVTRRGTGMLTMPLDPILGSARNELSRSNIPGALDAYAKLIKKGRFLDEVIHDLREALYRYPVEVNIWQSLGDAYMRSNRLQDALDAYTKAEELLR